MRFYLFADDFCGASPQTDNTGFHLVLVQRLTTGECDSYISVHVFVCTRGNIAYLFIFVCDPGAIGS